MRTATVPALEQTAVAGTTAGQQTRVLQDCTEPHS